jgi:hypothetical protein
MPECYQKCTSSSSVESFRKNHHIVEESLLAFGDKEGEELIPSLGFQFHCRQAISKKIKQEEIIVLSKMQEQLLSTRADSGLWLRTSNHCVNITVSFPTLLVFKRNSHLAAENRDLKCQGFDDNTFKFLAGRNPCRGPNVSGLHSHRIHRTYFELLWAGRRCTIAVAPAYSVGVRAAGHSLLCPSGSLVTGGSAASPAPINESRPIGQDLRD